MGRLRSSQNPKARLLVPPDNFNTFTGVGDYSHIVVKPPIIREDSLSLAHSLVKAMEVAHLERFCVILLHIVNSHI